VTQQKVVIIGAGPAGLFAAQELAGNGASVTIVERGREMASRHCPAGAECSCPTCDIMCGVGGAGGFSDGKNTISLTRGTQGEDLFPPDAEEIMWHVDSEVVRLSGVTGVVPAPVPPREVERFRQRGFALGSYPLRHVGSDGIRKAIIAMARELRHSGVEILTRTGVETVIADSDGVSGVVLENGGTLLADRVMIATGLDGQPWAEAELRRLGARFLPGPAGIGIRLETPASTLDPLFEAFYDWKLERGRLRSFCCNGHGSIVNENHARMGVRNVNGHSYLNPRLRTFSSNCCILAKIPAMTATDVQRTVVSIARAVNAAAGGHTAVQSARDFVAGVPTSASRVPGRYRTNFQSRAGVDIGACLDIIPGLAGEFRDYLIELNRLVPGVLGPDALIYAPEVKYYSRRVAVDAGWQCDGVHGLYVVGNASGYLDSFVAAATSGIIAAKDILRRD
jgi:uncharacterized FAD-dependent dehydrogenase